MNTMKQTICNKMSKLYDHLLATYMDSFEKAAVEGNVEDMEYWDNRIADCLAKKEKYEIEQK